MDNSSNQPIFDPRFRRNLKLEELYQAKHEELVRKKIQSRFPKPKELILMIVFLFALSLPFISIYVTSTLQDIRIKAVENKVTLFLYPKIIEVKKGESITVNPKMIVDRSKKISSVQILIIFDNSHVQLTKVQTGSAGSFKKGKYTSLQTANATGKLLLRLESDNNENTPTSVVNLPKLDFIRLTEDGSSINFATGESKIIFASGEEALVELDTPIRVLSLP